MADNKQISIKGKIELDTKVLEGQIKQLQQKMNAATQARTNLSGDPLLSAQANRSYGDTQASSQAELRRMYQEKRRQAMQESITIRGKQQEIKNLEKMEGNLTKSQERKVKLLKEELGLLKERNRVTIDQASKISAAGGGIKGGAIDSETGMPQEEARKLKQGKMWQLASKMLVMAAGAAAVGGQFYGHRASRDRELQASQARQYQLGNIGFQSTMSNQGFMNFYERGERRNAMNMALKERETRVNRSDPLKAIGRVVGAAGAGMLMGGGIGPGAALGAAIGAGTQIFGDKGIYNQLFDREAYKSSVNADTYSNFRKNLMSERMKNPGKFEGAKQFNKRQQGFQNLQRSLNLSDYDLLGDKISKIDRSGVTDHQKRVRIGQGQRKEAQYDGEFGAGTKEGLKYFVEEDEVFKKRLQDRRKSNKEAHENNRNAKEGFLESRMKDRSGKVSFSEERIKSNINQILQAGGSTEFAKGEGSTIAAEYQRAGYTNAGRELGQLSGLGGNSKQTEQAYLRLLAEGTKQGFDMSKTSEETRRWLSVTTSMMEKTAGAEGAVAVLGQGMAGTSKAAMTAAQSIYGRINKEAGQSTGYRGALKQSYLQSDLGKEAFGKVDENIRQALTEVDINHLDKNSPLIREAAKQQGVSPQDMINNIRNLQNYSANRNVEVDEKRKKLKEAYKKFRGEGKDSAQLRRKFFKSDGQSALVGYNTAFGLERNGIGNLNKEEQYSLGSQALGGDPNIIKAMDSDSLSKKLLKVKSRAADEAEGSTSKDQMVQLSLINDNLSSLKEAFTKNQEKSIEKLKHIARFDSLLEKIIEIGKTDKTTAGSLLGQVVEKAAPTDAPTVGKGF